MGSPIGCPSTARRGDQPPHNHSIMDSKLLFPLATAFLVLCLVETGSSIKCHQCNSYDSYHCADPFYYEDSPDVPKTNEFLKDCPADTADKTYFCRKIYQNVRGDERVIRGCGYEEDAKGRECYTTVLEEYNTEVCACKEDGCNSASGFSLSAALVSAVGLAYLLH